MFSCISVHVYPHASIRNYVCLDLYVPSCSFIHTRIKMQMYMCVGKQMCEQTGILMSFEWAMSRLLTCPLWENGYDHAMEPMLYEFMAQQLEEFDESWNSFSHSSPLYSQMKIEQVKIKQRDARKKQVKKEKQEARRQGVDLNKSYSSGHSRQRRGSTFGGGISRTPMNQSIRGSVSAKKPGRKNSEKWVPLSQKKWRLKENSTPQDRQTAGNNDARYGQHEDGNNTSGVNPSNDGGARGLYHYRNDRQNDGYSGDGDGQMRDLSQSMKNVHLNASPSPNTNLSQSFQSPYAKTRPNNIGTENDKGYNTSQYGGHGKEGYGSPQYGNGNYSGSYDSYGDSGYNTHHDNRGNNDNDGYNSNHNNGSGGNGYPSGHFNGNQHPPSQHQNQHQNQHNQNWHNNDYTSNNNNNKNNAGVQDATRFPPLSPSSQQYNNYNNNNDSGNSRYHDNGGKNGQADSHINSVETGVGAGTNNGGAANNGSAFVRKRR